MIIAFLLINNNKYDRIVLSDDFDEKINKSEDKPAILLKKLKGLLSVAKRKNGKSIPIIYICTDKKMVKHLWAVLVLIITIYSLAFFLHFQFLVNDEYLFPKLQQVAAGSYFLLHGQF